MVEVRLVLDATTVHSALGTIYSMIEETATQSEVVEVNAKVLP